jgi:hypothetical protein
METTITSSNSSGVLCSWIWLFVILLFRRKMLIFDLNQIYLNTNVLWMVEIFIEIKFDVLHESLNDHLAYFASVLRCGCNYLLLLCMWDFNLWIIWGVRNLLMVFQGVFTFNFHMWIWD